MGSQALARREESRHCAAQGVTLLLLGEHPPAWRARCGSLGCEILAFTDPDFGLAEGLQGSEVLILPPALYGGDSLALARWFLAHNPRHVVMIRGAAPSAALRAEGIWALPEEEDAALQLVEMALEIAKSAAREREFFQATRRANGLQLAGQMALEVAHELNNALTSLSANLHYLSQVAHFAGDHNNCLEEIQLSVRQIQHLARNLRQMSWGTPERFQQVSIQEIARRAIESARIRAGNRVSVRLLMEGDVAVLGDPHQLLQVLINLLFNGIQAAEGCLEGAVSVTVTPMGHRVRLSVEDSGSGVPESIRERIFEPFFTTRTESGGSGLGLSICKEIVEHHGGSLSLEPRPKGARFVLYLPLAGVSPLPHLRRA